MRRGDIVTIALQGDHGKPRPALVVQSDLFDTLAMLSVLPLTSTLLPDTLVRVDLKPDAQNGLRQPSQVMVDRIVSARRMAIGGVVGHVDDATMVEVNRAMMVFLGLA